MDEQLKQIGERLRGLRDVLDITTEEVAANSPLPTCKKSPSNTACHSTYSCLAKSPR